mgnify:CR=1 FL=1
MSSYDIIGDIHGEADALTRLLDALGYIQINGVYTHSERQALFLGDFIDRGPGQRDVLGIVRPMVDNGTALAVMGNHEFNAIAYATPTRDTYLRLHTDKNRRQHAAFLDAFENEDEDYQETIGWFKTLPLWLDLPDLRVVHACWDATLINRLIEDYDGAWLSDALLVRSSMRGTWEYEAIETLLKGKEIELPCGHRYHDKDGVERHAIRVKWWQAASTYRDAYIGPPLAESHIPDDPISGDHLIEYACHEKPVFIGHYWLSGQPAPLAQNIACVDYSVAKPGGVLAAYRFDGESELSEQKFVTVEQTPTRTDKSI